MSDSEIYEYIEDFIRYGGCMWQDKYVSHPYSIKDKYRKLDDLLMKILGMGER